MELVGKTVIKEFKGHGVFEGVVKSYDPTSGFYHVSYEDGDSEDVDFSEVSRLILLADSSSVGLELAGKKVGRRPKKRPRSGSHDPGKLDVDSIENLVVEPKLGCNLENNVDFDVNVGNNVNVDGNVDDVSEGDVGNVGNRGLDLNRGIESNEGVENGGRRECIDLNLSVEGCEFEGNGEVVGKVESFVGGGGDEGKREREFDLNLGFSDDGGLNLEDGDVGLEACGEELRNEDDGKNVGVLDESGSDVVTPVKCEDGNSARKKRRKADKILSSPAETVLRRSARRAKAAALVESVTPGAVVEGGASDVSMSGVTEELEVKPVTRSSKRPVRAEKPVGRPSKRVVEPEIPLFKVELPPSSARLVLEGIPVIDVFSIYSCLRSFSTLLYLSPFELEDFVEALKNKVSNLLIDSIHVSILLTLRKHLESLASEGCESAASCLRNLNWDLLDVVTWPVYMVEYLLIHTSGLKPGFSINKLKLSDGDYYTQPANVKIELLRCLCDDVIEVEVFRSELNRRKLMVDANMEGDRTIGGDSSRKRKVSTDASGDICLNEDVEEVADGNSDECCLCKMDGNLICCDGCPAAYHSKCVGIISSFLPEGDWYCPECAISRRSLGNKPRKLSRGAELLGTDPYGRLFYGCFDYLLVSDSCDMDSSFSYYHRDDLISVIQLLRSSNILYAPIVSSILQHCALPTDFGQLKSDSESRILKDEASVEEKTKCPAIEYACHLGVEGSVSAELVGIDSVKHCSETENQLTSSEGSDEVLQVNGVIQNSHRPLSNVSSRGTLAKRISAAKRKKKSRAQSKTPLLKVKEADGSHDICGYNYMNCYDFARTAASVVEELLRKPSDKVSVGIPKTEEEIIAIQLKFIVEKSSKLCWTTIQELNGDRQREKCDWCYCCRFPIEDRNCLFHVTNSSSIPKAPKADINGIISKGNKKGHLVNVICYILYMEERLQGLLLGPWLSPQYSEFWRKRVLKASDVLSLKHPLLMLESYLHPLALSGNWCKHVDSVTTMGSASHFVSSSRVNSRNGIIRKRGKSSDNKTKPSTAGSGLRLFWWRGGRTSRSLFNWKVVPRSLALKVARKAGCVKIPDIFYSDGSDNAKRSKFVSWRAAVEASSNAEQLALQVRVLDSYIRWGDIENTHPHILLDKESVKSSRLFKKVIIRRKCVEGSVVKYLLDFGKRRSIPDVVIKHGLKLVDTDNEKKRYWLDENYVPLHLLKNFEEKRILRKAGKTKSSKACKGGRATKKLCREKGFEYLFSRAERADNYQCGHCNKNVPISEAVNCQGCEGFFHKRHVLRSSEGIAARCTYTCHKCRAGKQVKKDNNRGKKKLGKLRFAKNLKVGRKGRTTMKSKPKVTMKSKRKVTMKSKPKEDGKTLSGSGQMTLRNDKKLHDKMTPLALQNLDASVVTLRRSARKASSVTVQSNVLVGGRKRKRNKDDDAALKSTSKNSFLKKRRTQMFSSFWIDGLWLSRKPNDERVATFKTKKLLVSGSSAEIIDQPKCSLCSEQESKSAAIYIACDICGDWFHGMAFGLNEENIEGLMGFKCHVCREISAPICPFVENLSDNGASFVVATSEAPDAQVLPEVISEKETDGLEVALSSEDPFNTELTQQSSHGNHDYQQASILDSDLKVQSGSPTSKEVMSELIESQDRESEANLTTESDGNGVLERNDIKSNDREFEANLPMVSNVNGVSERNDMKLCDTKLEANLTMELEDSVLETNDIELSESQLSSREQNASPAH